MESCGFCKDQDAGGIGMRVTTKEKEGYAKGIKKLTKLPETFHSGNLTIFYVNWKTLRWAAVSRN
jgi:hypothetical protein